jgi:thioesterase domain-containing protein
VTYVHELVIPSGFESVIEQLWQAKIPLASTLEVRVLRLDRQMLELGAPLAPNCNHMGTAFAGSLLSVASLAGWGTVVVLLGSVQAAQVVVQHTDAAFLEPVTADFRVRGYLPDAHACEQFLTTFRRYGRGRVSITAEVVQGERVAARVQSRFVAVRA